MRLKELTLSGYRNYDQAELAFGDLTLFVGQNAQGKTNILEAVSLCSTGRSHRTRRERELIGWEQPGCRVFARVERLGGERTLEIELSRQERRIIRVNGLPVRRLGEMMGVVNSVFFSPEDLRLVKDGPGERRRFMDMELSQVNPAYFYSLQAYQKILQQRNALLHNSQGANFGDLLAVWDQQLVQEGMRIVEARRAFAQRLCQAAREIHAHLSGGREELAVRYEGDVEGDAEAFQNKLLRLRDQEQRRMTTLVGPHRDDLSIEINGVDARSYGSQGQQRTAALALKLSEIVLMEQDIGEKPILLLDDVLSELDESRQAMLFDYVGSTQTLLTCTHFEAETLRRDALIYSVAAGRVTPLA